jgi:hypothetical protein
MEDQHEVLLFASPEIEEVLADNRVDLVELLQREGLEVSRSMLKEQGLALEPGLKEPVSIILASAAVIAALTPAITRAISALSRKQVLVTERVLAPVETSTGEVVRDPDGRPVLHWADRARLVEPKTTPSDHASLKAESPLGLTISFETSSNV